MQHKRYSLLFVCFIPSESQCESCPLGDSQLNLRIMLYMWRLQEQTRAPYLTPSMLEKQLCTLLRLSPSSQQRAEDNTQTGSLSGVEVWLCPVEHDWRALFHLHRAMAWLNPRCVISKLLWAYFSKKNPLCVKKKILLSLSLLILSYYSSSPGICQNWNLKGNTGVARGEMEVT